VQARNAGYRPTGRLGRALGRAPALAIALAGVGCADLAGIEHQQNPSTVGNSANRYQRELEMNRQWQNRPLSELVSTLGEPRITMNIPGGGNPPGFAVVYGQDARTGCIDAFAVNAGREPKIRIYYCR
jgi:hypothetical protein